MKRERMQLAFDSVGFNSSAPAHLPHIDNVGVGSRSSSQWFAIRPLLFPLIANSPLSPLPIPLFVELIRDAQRIVDEAQSTRNDSSVVVALQLGVRRQEGWRTLAASQRVCAYTLHCQLLFGFCFWEVNAESVSGHRRTLCMTKRN